MVFKNQLMRSRNLSLVSIFFGSPLRKWVSKESVEAWTTFLYIVTYCFQSETQDLEVLAQLQRQEDSK